MIISVSSPVKEEFSVTLHWAAKQGLMVLCGTAFLAICSYATIPAYPIPVTMQTFAVSLIGCLYGKKTGTMLVLSWLFQGFMGMPVLAGGTAGVEHFIGPEAGYLMSFPLMTMLTGWMIEKSTRLKFINILFAVISGQILCLTLGSMWLSFFTGLSQSIDFGFLPFIKIEITKSFLVASFFFFPKKLQDFFRRS